VAIQEIDFHEFHSWVKHFNDRIVPTSAKYGVRVLGAG
jgi:hypothetical protein